MRISAIGIAFAVMMTLATVGAQASQKSKNMWRNLAIGGAALGGVGLLTHSGAAAVVGLGGGAYAASRYEHDRHAQSKERSARYHRHARYYWYQGHEYEYDTYTGQRYFIR